MKLRGHSISHSPSLVPRALFPYVQRTFLKLFRILREAVGEIVLQNAAVLM